MSNIVYLLGFNCKTINILMNKYIIVLVCVASLFSCTKKREAAPSFPAGISVLKIAKPVDTVPRTSITFILGKDPYQYNQYYTLANHYYRLHPEGKTEIIVDNFTSIKEVWNYLRAHPAKNNRPYGLINLVSHGNEFLDLSTLVYPYGPRVSAITLQKAIQDSIFTPLDTTILDDKSLIFLHGCAVGNNLQLLNNLAIAFGAEQNGVRVKASKLFEYYSYLSKNRNPQSVRHYYAKTWYAFYHPDTVPNNLMLAEQFAERYPNDNVNWLEGVLRRFQSNPSEIYHFSFIVPAVWEDVYEDETLIPSVNTRSKRQEWINNNQSFTDMLNNTGIPYGKFQIKFYRHLYRRDAETLHGLRIKARAGIMCLTQPLLAESDSLRAQLIPFIPDDNDTAYFQFSEIKKEEKPRVIRMEDFLFRPSYFERMKWSYSYSALVR